ncbi:MAG: azurin [Weeksellaceae bacterium]
MKKLFLLMAAAFLVVSCGEKQADTSVDETPVAEETVDTLVVEETDAVDATSTDPNVANLVIEGDDQMKFNVNELKVKAGQKVKLTLKHVGTMGTDVMGHNWILLKSGTDVHAFGMAAVTAKDNDYIPAEMNDNIIVHTKLIGGGESVTIEFDAPEAGVYDFLCSFPGHFSVMQGKFIVE